MAIATDDDVVRRDLLAALGALGIAVLGAGFERPAGSAVPTTSPPSPPPSPPFDVTLSVTPWPDAVSDDAETTGPTPPSTPESSTTAPAPATAAGRRTPSDEDDQDGDGSGGDGATGGSSTPGALSAGQGDVVVEDGVRLADVLPGDGGVLTATLGVTGAPVSVDLYADASEFTEGGVVEPERPLDATPDAGELQEFVEVTFWHDRDGDGAVDPDESLFYEGPLAGLRTLRSGVSLGACVPPGEHRLALRWRLPAEVDDVAQTDGATVSLTCVARACADFGGE